MKKYSEKKIGLTTFLFILICAVLITALATFFTLNQKLTSSAKTVSQKEALVAKLIKADELLTKRYLYNLPSNTEFVDGILKGYMDSLNDRYAIYLDKASYRAYSAVQNGYVSMLGIVSSFDGSINGIHVDYVVKDSPADKAGIVKGDIITNVGGIKVTKYNYFIALNSLMGKEDSMADLQLSHNGEALDISVKLSYTKPPSVFSHFFENDGLGLINIPYFTEKTADEFKEAINGFETAISGLIIDLRGNPGGNLEQATKVLDLLLPDTTLYTAVYSENISSTSSQPQTAVSDSEFFNTAIIVLADHNTRGVAEIFAAVLQSNDCPVVGVETYGKVAFQEAVNLGDETGIYFTSKRFLDSKNNEISHAVVPEKTFELAPEKQALLPSLEYSEDDQITSTIEYFKALLQLGPEEAEKEEIVSSEADS
ncbi:MAG: PDZ domain-containing protein [Ruminococcaceae bacterium]|nr:PDZ domain-containing protein [Oscillospiraceae bacterium]